MNFVRLYFFQMFFSTLTFNANSIATPALIRIAPAITIFLYLLIYFMVIF